MLSRLLAAASAVSLLASCVGDVSAGGDARVDARWDLLALDAGPHDSAKEAVEPPDGGRDLSTDQKADTTSAPAGCFNLGAWTESSAFADSSRVSHPLPSFAVGQWYFVHTMKSGGSSRELKAAKAPTGGGALGPWQVASADHGGGPHGYTAIVVAGEPFHFRNGHIARYVISGGTMQGDVKLREGSVDTSFGGNKYVWDSAVVAKLQNGARYVFHLGGFSFSGYTYKPHIYRSAVPISSAFSKIGKDHPSTRPGKVAFYAPPGGTRGYLFTGEGQGSKIWRAGVENDGAIGAFAQIGDLPAGTGNQRGDFFVRGRTLFIVRGTKVFRAFVAPDGTLSAWGKTSSLPAEPIDIGWGDGHLEGQSHGVIGDHVYLTGAKTVYSARFVAHPSCVP